MKLGKRQQDKLLKFVSNVYHKGYKHGEHSGQVDIYKKINEFICENYHRIEHEFPRNDAFLVGWDEEKAFAKELNEMIESFLTPKTAKKVKK